MCGAAKAADFEARGSAVGMAVYTASSSTTLSCGIPSYWVTNISGSEITCRFKVYDHDGNDISSLIDVFTGNNTASSAVMLTSGAQPFTLPAGATRFVRIWDENMDKLIHGHAVIEWSSEDPNIKKALMAIGRWYHYSKSNYALAGSIPVNGGQPF